MKRRRLRKWAKWACTGAGGVAVSVAVLSRWFWCSHVTNHGLTTRYAEVGSGLLWVQEITASASVPRGRPEWRIGRSHRWYWGLPDEDAPRVWAWRNGILCFGGPDFWQRGVSLSYPVMLTALPAGLLWYADRRRFGPGHCAKCGYDRLGLAADAKCPECGSVPEHGGGG